VFLEKDHRKYLAQFSNAWAQYSAKCLGRAAIAALSWSHARSNFHNGGMRQ
jgi:hypothetical protein